MTSEDVIHSFFVPAFRTKQDVVPGRYSTIWFQPTKPGKYHLFCAEYCGTNHSGMIGWIYVMEPQDYQDWLSGGAPTGSLAENGAEAVSATWPAPTATRPTARAAARRWWACSASTVQLAGGATVKADEAYIRESILQPDGQGRGRLPADHADVPGPGHRGRACCSWSSTSSRWASRPARRRPRRSTTASQQTRPSER